MGTYKYNYIRYKELLHWYEANGGDDGIQV